MKPPIKDKFSKQTIDKINQLVKDSIKTGSEYGMVLCSNKEITDTGNICIGEGCVNIKGICGPPLSRQGFFHTHPQTKDMIDSLKKSDIWDLVKDDTDYFIKKSLINFPPSVSAGDLAAVLASVYGTFGVEGTTCIADDRESDTMYCYTLNKYISEPEIQKVVNRYARSTDRPPKELLKNFEKEKVKLK